MVRLDGDVVGDFDVIYVLQNREPLADRCNADFLE